MSEQALDIIGGILWFAMFATPLFTIPLVWKFFKATKVFRVLVALVLAAFISLILYEISLSIIFRDGMGPS
jgi:membrane protein DedA with SNARE-associated domain